MKLCKSHHIVLVFGSVLLCSFNCQAVAPRSNSLDTSSKIVADVIKDETISNVEEQCPGNRRMIDNTTKLSLDSIRNTLIRLEETIVFALIERAQYRCNFKVYKKESNPGISIGSHVLSGESKDLSLLEYFLIQTEQLNHVARRYECEDETAFFAELLQNDKGSARTSELDKYLSNIGGAADVNFNHILLKKYINGIVPVIATPGEDENFAASISSDVMCLQALSRRVHYGKFVAEAKYLADPLGYQKLVDANDTDGVMELLSNKAVEKKVLERVKLKAAAYGTGPLGGENSDCKVDPEQIKRIYHDILIPITKDIEVDYLFRRCGKPSPSR